MGDIRTDLDGLRMRKPGDDAVYLIDEGKKRYVPYEAYITLFKNWEYIHLDINIDNIETGDPIDQNAWLWKCNDNPKVYLMDGKPGSYKKRHIKNTKVFKRFHFSWENVQRYNVPHDTYAPGIDDGPQLVKEGRID